MNTLWNKGLSATDIVEEFTVGNDRILDMKLAKYDVIGTKAHVKMLRSIGLLSSSEEQVLLDELDIIAAMIESGDFKLEESVEDIHSQIELLLTRKVGESGKKVHSGRSRNDQVLVDIKLFLKDEIVTIKDEIISLFDKLQELSELHKNTLMPGYTHTQVAMPSSFGLWFGAFAEILIDDMFLFKAAYDIVDQNPLGSAAGYGNSFPLDRTLTTELLGFSTLNYNSVSAQLSRGKCEKAVASALSSLASTLNKISDDSILYMSPNFGFISFPDNLTTGSSIMPHKKNPDVWEVIRATSNRLQSIPNEISLLTTNMIHGYHRDFQLLKDILFPALEQCHKILIMTQYMLEHIIINTEILENSLYDYLFTVEEVNKLVLSGTPFREAYKIIGQKVADGSFKSDKRVNHTHQGSIGNLCTKEIKDKMKRVSSLIR